MTQIDDSLLSKAELIERHGGPFGEHPAFPRAAWERVRDGSLSYWDWVGERVAETETATIGADEIALMVHVADGDFEVLFRACWEIMTPEQRNALKASEEVLSLADAAARVPEAGSEPIDVYSWKRARVLRDGCFHYPGGFSIDVEGVASLEELEERENNCYLGALTADAVPYLPPAPVPQSLNEFRELSVRLGDGSRAYSFGGVVEAVSDGYALWVSGTLALHRFGEPGLRNLERILYAQAVLDEFVESPDATGLIDQQSFADMAQRSGGPLGSAIITYPGKMRVEQSGNFYEVLIWGSPYREEGEEGLMALEELMHMAFLQELMPEQPFIRASV